MIPKFRAWYTPFGGSVKQFNKMKHGSAGSLLTHAEMSPDDYKIMQSTGLKDKNGVEIFEGDVVKMDRPPVNEKSLFLVKDYVLGKVIFAEVNEFGKDSWSFNGGYTGYSLEVIGNVWEDGDLINDGKRTK